MSLNDALKKITSKARETQGNKQRFKRDQAFLPGVDLATYQEATNPTQIDSSSIGSFIKSATRSAAGKMNPAVQGLKKAIPTMRQAFMNRDIFAYNIAKEKLDKASGKKIPEAPDPLMIRKEARRRVDRTRVSSRASTLGLKY